MTDLEMTKRCAIAMGWKPAGTRKDFDTVKCIPVEQFPGACHYQYAPLKGNSDAMALVEKLRLTITWHFNGLSTQAICYDHRGENRTANRDLNRAIVECVAKSTPDSSTLSQEKK